MHKFLLLLSAGMLLSIIACNRPSGTSGKEADTESNEVDMRSSYTSGNGRPTGMNVELNDGMKWIANMETTKGIWEIQGLANELNANSTIEDFREASKKMVIHFQKILQKCTMKGEAHNQLHNYLMPLKEKIDFLGTADLTNCRRMVPGLQDYLMKYSYYFI
jgi:hypothetical protein